LHFYRPTLAASRKPRLGFELLSELVFRPLAHPLVLALAPLRVPPPAVVLAGNAVGVAAAVELARGHLVVAALLVQLKTLLDGADGQLARATNRVTAFGRYLDSESDLLVDAALFAALGWYAHAPLAALAGFCMLTAVLSVNFNVERIARGTAPAWDTSVLGRVYALLYGWQDRALDRVLARVRIRPWHVGALANLGMSTQLALFGVCLALGRPLVYVWLLLAQVVVVTGLFTVFVPNREVSLEHR
jgi:phosphatidylglycerophosphate synthase